MCVYMLDIDKATLYFAALHVPPNVFPLQVPDQRPRFILDPPAILYMFL